MDHEKMCHLNVVMKNGESFQQRNLMLTDITLNEMGLIVKTELGIKTYHNPNILVSTITYINDEDDEE